MKTGRILMAMQAWPGDLPQAEALLTLCADLTLQANAGKPSPHADLLMVLRYDCSINQPFLRTIASAFGQVRIFRTRERCSGWPAGPNQMARETWQYFVSKQQSGQWNYSGIWFTEADSVPLTADFLARIHREWRACQQPILGCHIGSFSGFGNSTGEGHINGNCVMAPEIASLCPEILSRPTAIAWDAHHRRDMVRLGKASMQIYSDYKLGESVNPWRDCEHLWRGIEYFDHHPLRGIRFQPAWVHGVKDARGLSCARVRLIQLVNDGGVDVSVALGQTA